MTKQVSTPEEHFLIYFDRIVLCRYRSRPDLFRVDEDDMGGVLRVISHESDNDAIIVPYFEVRFGFRQLADGRTCVAAFGPDLQSLPDAEKTAWKADYIETSDFASSDEAFSRWSQRYLHGSWESEDGPLCSLEKELDLIRAMTQYEFGKPLVKESHNPALNYPVAENSEAFTLAMTELFRLVVDGLSLKSLIEISEKLDVKLPVLNGGEKRGSLNTLRDLLPYELHESVYQPLRMCRIERNKMHGVPSEPAYSFAAFKTFHKHVADICNAVRSLKKWLEEALNVSANSCLKREQAMVHFPKFDGPLRPDFKNAKMQQMIGKTIAKVEAGEFAPGQGCHQREAIKLHFTDGTILAIDVGSNAGNLESRFEGLDASMFSVDLIPMWAPDPKVDRTRM